MDMICCLMTKIDFAEWLDAYISEKGIKPVELARMANIDPGVVTRIIKAERAATPKTLKAIAQALRLPTDFVFEKAGLLQPKADELSPIKRKLIHIIENSLDSDAEIAINLLEQRQEYYKKNPQAKPSK